MAATSPPARAELERALRTQSHTKPTIESRDPFGCNAAMVFRRLCVVLVALAFSSNVLAQTAKTAPPSAPAPGAAPGMAPSKNSEDEARAHFLLGRSFHDRGEFAKAAAEFEQAYAASGRAALLYNLFVAYRDANDAKRAADALRRYLDLEKNVENRPQLEAKLEAMEAALAAQLIEEAANPQPTAAQAEAQETSEPTEPEPVAAADVEPMEEPHESAFPIGPVIVIGVGGAMMLGSIATGLMASSAQGELEDMCPTRMNCGSDLEDTQSKGETMALVTDILLFGGVAVAAGGAAWWLFGSSDSESSASARLANYATHASLMCTNTACAANVHGTF
jgi:tetratricopeptide (TPR) repeat protein